MRNEKSEQIVITTACERANKDNKEIGRERERERWGSEMEKVDEVVFSNNNITDGNRF